MSTLKFYLTFFGFILFLNPIYTQESIGKKYKLKDTISADKKIPLQVEKITLYKDLTAEEKKPVDRKINLLKRGITEHIKLQDSVSNELMVTQEIINNSESYSELLKSIAVKTKVVPDFIEMGKKSRFNGNVLFEKNKIYVNPWNYIERRPINKVKGLKRVVDSIDVQPYKDDKKELFYQLTDGQTAKISFAETTLTSLIIPIKYRFKATEQFEQNGVTITNEIDETFTTNFNLSFFVGRSWGRTRFNHRIKVGNRIVNNKHSIGGIVGAGAESLSLTNTDGTKTEEEISGRTIGFLTFGGGYVFSSNKFAFGFFAGIDWGVGEISNTWDYDSRLWVGIGVGYDIFKL